MKLIRFFRVSKGLNLILFFFIFSSSMVLAQRTISGTVSDGNTNEPLVGVNIQAKGTSIGAVTDINGKYTLAIYQRPGCCGPLDGERGDSRFYRKNIFRLAVRGGNKTWCRQGHDGYRRVTPRGSGVGFWGNLCRQGQKVR